MTQATPEYDVAYIVNGNQQAKIASIASDHMGPLQVSQDHIFVKMTRGNTTGAQTVQIGLSELEFACMDNIKFDDDLDKENKTWFAPPARWTCC